METRRTLQPEPSTASTCWTAELTLLYSDNFDALVHIAGGVLRNRSEAEDAVQDSFLRFASGTANPAPGKELAYLKSMVRNRAISMLRRGGTEARAVEQLRSTMQSTTVSAESAALGGIASESLVRHLASLSERQRRVVSLRYVTGLSVAETATQLDVAEGTVKAHTYRGSSALRAVMSTAA